MVRTGEIPRRGDETPAVGFGEAVFDASGRHLGRVRGLDGDGFYITRREGLEAMSVQHVRSDGRVGEAELVWRCMECGAVDALGAALPERCPNCGSARESLMYWTED